MAAYVILDVTVENPEAYEYYKQVSGAALSAHGGRFIVRGGACEVIEGDWEPGRIVVVQFDTMEKAKAWYESEEYRQARELRWKASRGKMLLVDGIPEGVDG